MCPGLNSHCFHIIGDGHQPNSRDCLYPVLGFPIKGGMTIPNIRSLDPSTDCMIELSDFVCFVVDCRVQSCRR